MEMENETDITTQPHVHPLFQTNVAVSVLISLFLVVGTSGSLVTAIVIGRTRSCHTKANIFIFSLCVSDLISAIICSPLWLYRRTWGFEYWAVNEFFCRFYWVIDFTTNYLTSLHIVSFSAIRYVAIKWPFFEMKLSKRMIVGYILMLWFLSTIFALPLGHLMGVDPERDSANIGSCWPSCSVAAKRHCCLDQFRIYINIVNTLIFYLPQWLIIMFSLLICYEIKKNMRLRRRHFANVSSSHSSPSSLARYNKSSLTSINTGNIVYCNTVAGSLQHNSSPRIRNWSEQTNHDTLIRSESDNKENGAFLQLFLIIVAYNIGYIPTTIYLQWATAIPSSHEKAEIDYWFGLFSYLLLRLSECMNPFMYNFGSSKLRKETKKFLKGLMGCC